MTTKNQLETQNNIAFMKIKINQNKSKYIYIYIYNQKNVQKFVRNFLILRKRMKFCQKLSKISQKTIISCPHFLVTNVYGIRYTVYGIRYTIYFYYITSFNSVIVRVKPY